MTEQELARAAPRRLAIIGNAQEFLADVPLLRDHPPDPLHLASAHEEHGLQGLRDRSRRPHTLPDATEPEVVGKIVHLRRNYHFRPHKISMYLKRYHDIEVSPLGLWRRILKGLDMSRLPAS